MDEIPNDEPVSEIKINITPDKLRRLLRTEGNKDRSIYLDAARHSRDYMDALGLNPPDVETMEKRQGKLNTFPQPSDYLSGALVRLEVDGERFGLVAKHTAVRIYGDQTGWQHLLLAIAEKPDQNSEAGTGTSWINAIPDGLHSKIVQAIRASDRQDDLSQELFGGLKPPPKK